MGAWVIETDRAGRPPSDGGRQLSQPAGRKGNRHEPLNHGTEPFAKRTVPFAPRPLTPPGVKM